MDAVALLSGGMDSSTLAYQLVRGHGMETHFLSFDYGQRHRQKELAAARAIATELGSLHDVISLKDVGALIAKGDSSLVNDEVDVPDGHYAEETMRQTIVPNRNAMMLSIATAVAIAEGAKVVGFGAHAGDHFIYPDCRPEFVQAFQTMTDFANEPTTLLIEAPFLSTGKDGIVRQGTYLGVPFSKTWSCYKGGMKHCGTCGTCNERKEAFLLANIPDPTDYLDDSPPAQLVPSGT